MEIIITPEQVKEHRIARYSFKNFDDIEREVVQSKPVTAPKGEAVPFSKDEQLILETIKAKQVEDGGMVAQLVKKVEEFGESVIKLQMRLEAQEEEFRTRLEDEKKRAYEDGMRAGEKGVENRLIEENEANKRQMIDSIKKLDERIEGVSSYVASLEKELSSIAVEIAAEVIAKEVREDGVNVAERLAVELLKEVKGANSVTIRIHPELVDEITKRLGNENNVKVVGDRAIAYGGLVLFSDAGNIDAQIKNRFMAVKNGILTGGVE